VTGKHYNWDKRWRLDPLTASAVHDSGWRVIYELEAARPIDANPPAIGGLCWTQDGRRYVVSYDGTEYDLNQWLAAQAERGLVDQNSVQARVARLMREAGELWVRHVERTP